jgi:hypothetical protein
MTTNDKAGQGIPGAAGCVPGDRTRTTWFAVESSGRLVPRGNVFLCEVIPWEDGGEGDLKKYTLDGLGRLYFVQKAPGKPILVGELLAVGRRADAPQILAVTKDRQVYAVPVYGGEAPTVYTPDGPIFPPGTRITRLA